MAEALPWEQRYLNLRDDHVTLNHKCNEQEDTIRRMNTKLAQIEKNLRLKQELDAAGVPGEVRSWTKSPL